MVEEAICPICKGTKHCRVIEGVGEQARWLYKPCACVVKERLRAYLGPFATAPRIKTSPILKFGTQNLFLEFAALQESKAHVGHFLRVKGLAYRYVVLDISALGALYVSKEDGKETDKEVFASHDLVMIFLNLTSIRSVKADELLLRAIQYRIFVSRPVWVFYSGDLSAMQKEFPASALEIRMFSRLNLKSSQVSAPLSSPEEKPEDKGKYGRYGL